MADTFLEEVAKYLDAQGIGTYSLDTNTAWGIYALTHPGTIDKIVLITPTLSAGDPDIPMTNWALQTMIIAPGGKDALDKAKEIYDLLHRHENITLVTIVVNKIQATSVPQYVGLDDDKRYMLSINWLFRVHGQEV